MAINRLSEESSLYLKQHAENPVNWYPWCDEAFRLAEEKNLPVFLSIGYSTCHWCHVMAHESFEDSDVAEILNTYFVSVKLDREERPDVDGVYMDVCQMMTGSGGWPLTIIMTPDKKPFFAATYIPKENRYGRTGLIDLLNRIKDIWSEDREKVLESGLKISELMKRRETSSENSLSENITQKAYEQLKQNYDAENGGFGNRPKFPSPHNLMFLMRRYNQSGDQHVLKMVEHTLQAMAMGGIHDHIGGGFHRYSTDEKWLVPHFEKMLYDQAMLLQAYSECFHITRKPLYRYIIDDIVQYLVRDMQDPEEGGFFSAEDADSEGEEGKFYIWTEPQLKAILCERDFKMVQQVYNTSSKGNFYEEHSGQRNGGNILYQKGKLQTGSTLDEIKNILFNERKKRIHPARDTKKLTDWNALMISAFTKAFAATGDIQYLRLAEKTADFIIEKRIPTENSRLLHAVMGENQIHGFLDDYAFFVEALVELYQCSFKSIYLKTAIKLADSMLDQFYDSEHGGFFFSPSDTELFFRKKDSYDGAFPSGNSAAVNALFRLSSLTGKPEYSEAAKLSVYAFSEKINSYPSGFNHLLSGYLYGQNGLDTIIVVSGKPEEKWREDVETIRKHALLNSVIILKTHVHTDLESVIPSLKSYTVKPDTTRVYYCRNNTCREPFEDIGTFLNWIKNS